MRGGNLHALLALAAFSLTTALAGCGATRTSDTARTGMEQLLISNAVDHVVDGIDFKPLAGKNVFIDDQYLECVDKKYVIGAVRHRAFRGGAKLVTKPEEADLVLEIHAGAVGTDKSDSFIGMPGIALPGPMPVQIPEIKLYSQSKQIGTAKIGLVAYDPKTREASGQGGLAMSRSDKNDWSILGVGPFTSGRVPDEIALSSDESLGNDLKQTLRSVNPFPGDGGRRDVQLATPSQRPPNLQPADEPVGVGATLSDEPGDPAIPYTADQRNLPPYSPAETSPGEIAPQGYGAPVRPEAPPAGAPSGPAYPPGAGYSPQNYRQPSYAPPGGDYPSGQYQGGPY